MAAITAALVKELREQTGGGMMDCKRVLVEADGDLEKAADLLRERGIAKAGKRAGRETTEGRVVAKISDDARCGALVELGCETDFVAKTDDFQALGEALVDAVLEHGPGDADALLDLSADGRKLADRVVEAIAKMGENIQVLRVDRLQASEQGRVASYVHAGGKIGVLVGVESDDASKPAVAEIAHNVCMHVAAMAPQGLSRDDLDPALVEKERDVLTKQAEQEGKPANIIEKMIDGRMGKFFKEVVLTEQQLVMDPDHTVGKAAKAAGASISAYRRFQLGEQS